MSNAARRSSRSRADGLNYTNYTTRRPYFGEIDCVSRHSGLDNDNDNGSTSHDGCIGFRVNGVYYGNKGPNEVDVGASRTFNIGCTAHTSTAVGATANANFYIATGGSSVFPGTAAMWLHDCNL
ncbi:hypothetical protein SAMN00790413_01028 [Deinococcus hopiensis KR-140]|uniref:Uncharacterized protein n=1 Tax=Deinococcus hopiensis KR-140 TaxID=695939 RepID=A0A1W1VCY8_9DEIO|nr:hypothetical protein SAMN00790413_01028 [Deinococcus hopiensis KR-140]